MARHATSSNLQQLSAPLLLAGLLPSIAPLAAPSGSVGAADLGRRLLQMEPPAQVQQLEQDAQQAVVPSPYRPCVPQLDIVFKLVFADSVDEPKYNQVQSLILQPSSLRD